jgi:hypothetical protein
VAVLHAEPLGAISSGYRILSAGEEITQLQISLFRGKGSFTLQEGEFTVEPLGFFRSDAVLKKGSSVIAKSKKSGALRRRFDISSAGHRLALESQKWTGREYQLLLGNRSVGTVKREGFAGRRVIMDFPDDVPIVLQVFLAFIVISQARREAAAASAGS